jgi:hypothetical protein
VFVSSGTTIIVLSGSNLPSGDASDSALDDVDCYLIIPLAFQPGDEAGPEDARPGHLRSGVTLVETWRPGELVTRAAAIGLSNVNLEKLQRCETARTSRRRRINYPISRGRTGKNIADSRDRVASRRWGMDEPRLLMIR